MKKYFNIIFIGCFFSLSGCVGNIPTEILDQEFSGESFPVGPLRICNAKVNSETTFRLSTRESLSVIIYEYYNNGLLKTKQYSANGYNTLNEYFYDNNANLILEVFTAGSQNVDTICYRYNEANRLVQKETIHSTDTFVLCDTVFYKYDSDENLSEWFRSDPYDNYKTMRREVNEYSQGLLIKTSVFNDNELFRTYEYNYFNNIKTKLFIYLHEMLEHRTIFYYQNGLLINEMGFFSNSEEYTDKILYEYNSKYELTVKKVFVPPYSSFVNHEIHFTYYQ